MKNAKVFMMLFSMALIMGAIILGTSSAQEQTDYLKLRGKILNEQKANITVYAQSNQTGEWVLETQMKDRRQYRIRLSTDINYRVVFSYPSSKTKVLNIDSGDPGMYIEYVDIDFKQKHERNAYMMQYNDDRYSFITASEYNSIALME